MPEENPFGYNIEVTGQNNLKKAVSVVEKSYLIFSKSISVVTKGLLTQVDRHLLAGKAAKKHAKRETESAKENEKAHSRREKSSNAFVKVLKREKEAARLAGVSFDNLAYYIGGATVVGGLYFAAKAYMDFDSQIRKLNATLSGTSEIMKGSIAGIRDLTGFLGMTREELVSTTKAMSGLAVHLKDIATPISSFNDLRKQAILLSKSMDVSTDSTIDFYTQFTRVYKLPHHRLRGISASFKAIQESTGLSGEEIMSFAKSLEDVLSRMTNTTDKAKTGALRDFTALTGGLKSLGVNVEGQQLAGLFSDVLKKESDQGRKWLAFVASQTGENALRIREMVKQGDLTTPFKLFIKSMKRLGPRMLEENETLYTSMTNMSFSQLMGLIKMNDAALEKQMRKAEVADQKRKKHEEEAMKRQNALSLLWNKFVRKMEDIWLRIGKVVIEAATRLSKYAIPLITKGLTWLEEKIAWFSSPEGGKQFNKWLVTGKDLLNDLGKVVNYVTQQVVSLIDWWQGLSQTNKTIISSVAGAAAAISLFSSPLSKVTSGVGLLIGALGRIPVAAQLAASKLGLIVAGMIATYKLAEKIAEYTGIDTRTKAKESRADYEENVTEIARRQLDRDTILRRVKGIANMSLEGARSELSRLKKEGVLTKNGEVRSDAPMFSHKGEAIAVQRALNKSLAKVSKVESLMTGKPVNVVEPTEQKTVSTPITSESATKTAPTPITVQSQENKQQLIYSKDIRNILLSIDNKLGRQQTQTHPSRLTQAIALGR